MTTGASAPHPAASSPAPGAGARRAARPTAPPLRAVLLATAADATGGPAAALRWEDTTLLGRLLDQLGSLGAGRAHVITRPEWMATIEPLARAADPETELHASEDLAGDLRAVAAIAAAEPGGLVIANAEVVTQREALAGLLADPRIATGALATRRHIPRFMAFGMQSRRAVIVHAASPYHRVRQSTETFLGVLKIADASRDDVVRVAERLAGIVAGPLPDTWRRAAEEKARQWRVTLSRHSALDGDGDGDPGAEHDEPAAHDVELPPEREAELARRLAAARQDAPALLLQGLVRESVPVGFGLLRRLFWTRALSAQDVADAETRIRDFDEERVLLESAVKANDGFFTTFFVSPYSRYVARWAARHGWSPNAVTVLSMVVAVVAAGAFATGERWGLVTGAILLQIAFMLDCVDGQLARYTRTFSRFGAWLDSVFDRGKEYVIYAGLAAGAASTADDIWLLAGAALALQTFRHVLAFMFNVAVDQSIGSVLRQPLMKRGDALTMPPRGRAALWVWTRKIIVLPIGERFAAISLTAALFDARVTFVVLLAWGGAACVYAAIGYLLRSLGRRGDTSLIAGAGSAPGPLGDYRDDGAGALALGRLLRPPRPVPPVALAGAAALPLVVAIALAGADASWGVVAGVVAWAVLLGGASSGRPLVDRLRWAVPAVLFGIEAAGLLWIAAIAGHDTLPAGFALLAAIAFRRYDLVYRDRHQRSLPPVWLARAAGGWDGRLLAGLALGAAGATPAGMWVAAAALGLLLGAESIASWVRFQRSSEAPSLTEGDGDD